MKRYFNRVKDFLESPWAIFLTGAITVLFYIFEVKYFQYCFFSVLGILLVITKAKWYLAPSLIFMTFASSRFNGDFSYLNTNSIGFILAIIFGLSFIGFLIYDIVINIKEYVRNVKKNWLLYSGIIVLTSMVISLIFSPVIINSLWCILGHLLLLLVIIIIPTKIDFSDKGKLMMMLTFIAAIYVIAFEVLFVFCDVHFIQGESINLIMDQKLLNLGWAISNRYVVICNIGLIACLYCYFKYDDLATRLLIFLSIFVGLVINFFSGCRAAYLGLIMTIPIIVIFYIRYYMKFANRPNEVKYLSIFGCLFALGIIFLFVSPFLQSALKEILERGFYLSGRDDVWEVAVNAFMRHPLIGCGPLSGSYYILVGTGRDFINNYHNFVLDALATTGIIGLLAFIFFIYVLIRRCFIKNDYYANVLLILIVYFLANGVVDSLFFNYQLMIFMIMPYALLPDNGIYGKTKKVEKDTKVMENQ